MSHIQHWPIIRKNLLWGALWVFIGLRADVHPAVWYLFAALTAISIIDFIQTHLLDPKTGSDLMSLMSEPIWVNCEGSNDKGSQLTVQQRTVLQCRMCGGWYPLAETVPGHKRQDVLAMIDRGDFN